MVSAPAPLLSGTAGATPVAREARSVGFWGGLSANVLNMIGIGPFITIPLAISAMGGPQAMLGWIAGALLCLCDGLVWAELGSALPQSGGSYPYLRQAFGPMKIGRLLGFLFLWQTLLVGPLSIAGAAVGSAGYATFMFPHLAPSHLVAVAAAGCLIATAILYRPIGSIQRLSMVVAAIVIAAFVWIIVSGALHFDPKLAFAFPRGAFTPNHAFWIGLGAASLNAVYDYGGYNNVCLIAGEMKSPRRNVPLAVLVSIPLVAALYMGLNLSILGALPWRQAAASQAVVADFMQAVYGRWGGLVVAVLILIAGWGGALAVLLGYSRVPYAAAVEGDFFKVFAKRHPTGGFPTVSLVFMGIASALVCVVPLGDLIGGTIVIQAMFQFILQCVAVALLRRKGPAASGAYRMPLYPLPVIVTLLGWLYIIFANPLKQAAVGVALLATGALIFLIRAQREQSWPFASP
jgi:amino acid transporter